MNPKYLPSKEFVARFAILAIGCVLVFGIYEITSYFKNRSHRNGATPLIVKDVVQKDSNNNGIPDWEEILWGLDPTKNGEANKQFILAKQQALSQANAQNQTVGDSGTSVENETLAKQFFATLMALQQSGDLNNTSLQSVVDTIGNQVQAKPIPDIYVGTTFKVLPSTKSSVITYITAVKNLLVKYKNRNIGDELTFIATALKNNDSSATTATADVAHAYKEVGKELTKIPTPSAALPLAVTLANDYEKTGQSIDGLSRILTDPIIGMQALINYKKYNDELVNNLGILTDFQ